MFTDELFWSCDLRCLIHLHIGNSFGINRNDIFTINIDHMLHDYCHFCSSRFLLYGNWTFNMMSFWFLSDVMKIERSGANDRSNIYVFMKIYIYFSLLEAKWKKVHFVSNHNTHIMNIQLFSHPDGPKTISNWEMINCSNEKFSFFVKDSLSIQALLNF